MDIKVQFEIFLKTTKQEHRDFYQKTDIDDATFNRQISSVKGFSKDSILKIKNAYPELNLNWLLAGKGEMLLREDAGSLQQINVNNGVMENSPLTATYKAGLCAECEAKLQEANDKIIKLQDELLSLYKKQTQ